MNAWKLVAFLGVFALLAVSCSRKKEEAARLEQEMMREAAADTTAEPGLAFEDTAEYAAPDLDAGAIPSEEKPKFVPQEEQAEGFVVQVAACESLEYAQYLVEKYTARGYSPYLTMANVGGQTYYRVRVGGFGTLQEAQKLQAELVDKFSVNAWIDHTE